MKSQKGRGYSSNLSLTSVLLGDGWLSPSHPCRFTPWKENRYQFLQEAGLNPGPVCAGTKNLAPPGFDPRKLQVVANPYTDCVVPGSIRK
jgi:hypothetical protein